MDYGKKGGALDAALSEGEYEDDEMTDDADDAMGAALGDEVAAAVRSGDGKAIYDAVRAIALTAG